MDILIKILITGVFIGFIVFQLIISYRLSVSVYDIWKHPINIRATFKNILNIPGGNKPNIVAIKKDNVVYQNDEEVAFISGNVQMFNEGIIISEIYNAQKLNFKAPLEIKGKKYMFVRRGPLTLHEFTESGHRVNVVKDVVCKEITQ